MLNRKTYFIRENIQFMKLSDTYDILDPETQEQIGIAKEKPGALIILLRLLIAKQLLPTCVNVYQGNDFNDNSKLLFSIKRGITFMRAKVNICDSNGTVVGYFKRKLFSLGGAFRVFDKNDTEVAFVKGDWKGWNFKFLDSAQHEIGTITKKWGGIAKELFTSADSYVIALNEEPSESKAVLLLAAGLAVDTVLKEKQR